MDNFEKPNASKEIDKRITSQDLATIETNYAKFAQLKEPTLLNTVGDIESGENFGDWKATSIAIIGNSAITGGLMWSLMTASDQTSTTNLVLTLVFTPVFGVLGTAITHMLSMLTIEKTIIGFLTTRVTSRRKYKQLALLEEQENRKKLEEYEILNSQKKVALSKIAEEAKSIVKKYNASCEGDFEIKFENGVFKPATVHRPLFSQMTKVLAENKELVGNGTNLAIAE